MKYIAAILVSVFILYLAFSVTMSGVAVLFEASRSKSWPTVEGTVTETSVARYRNPKRGTDESPVVRYQYEVDGKAYHRGKLSLDGAVTTSWFESRAVRDRSIRGWQIRHGLLRPPTLGICRLGTGNHGENVGDALARCPFLIRHRRLRDVVPARHDRLLSAVTEDNFQFQLARRASK